MRDINMVKYITGIFAIWFFWAFIGGIIISNYNNSNSETISVGAVVFLVGGVISYFIFNWIVKKGKFSWFLKNNDIGQIHNKNNP